MSRRIVRSYINNYFPQLLLFRDNHHLHSSMAAVQQPSIKKLGKRPELRQVDANPTTTNITVNSNNIDLTPNVAPSPPTPQQHKETLAIQQPAPKRKLPVRQRRGGPGIVGSCSIDQLIIETERRAR